MPMAKGGRFHPIVAILGLLGVVTIVHIVCRWIFRLIL